MWYNKQMSEEQPIVPEPIAVEPSADTNQLVIVNFQNGNIIDKVHFDGDKGVPDFLRQLAKHAKKTKVTSVMVITVDETDTVDWVHMASNEHQMALVALCLEDARATLKEEIFRDSSTS